MSVTKTIELRPWINKLYSYKNTKALKQDFVSSVWPGRSKFPSEVFVVGASSMGEGIVHLLRGAGITIGGLFDDDANKQGTMVGDAHVKSIDELRGQDKRIPVVLATQRILKLQERIEGMGFVHVWPFPVLSILAPEKFPPHPYYDGMFDDLFNNRDAIQKLYFMLEDEKSRATLDAVIGFRLTLNPKELEGIIIPDFYLSQEIFCFSDQEVLVDAGAFDGDTIRSFIRICSGKFKKIISIEPSKQPFNILKREFKADDRIKLLQACLYDEETTLVFEDSGQRDSAVVDGAQGTRVQTVKIDNLPEAGEITFIKMNIEGSEKRALLGAKKTIQRQIPKLAVAVYHRVSDLWMIPQLVKELNPDYKLYLRHHDGGIIETVLYATY